MKKAIPFLFCFLLLGAAARAGTTPAIGLHENTPNIVALTNATIVVKPGEIIKSGTVVIRDDRIFAVGEDVDIPRDAVVRNCLGMTVYPAFVELFSDYGISEVPAMKTASAHHWNPAVNAERNAMELFVTNKGQAARLRNWGFAVAVTCPSEGIFRGNGAVVLLKDGDAKEALLDESPAMPLSFIRGGQLNYPNSRMGSVALLRQAFLDADWYARAHEIYRRSPEGQHKPETNVSLAALSAHCAAKRPFAAYASDSLDLFRFAKIGREFGLDLWHVGTGYEYRRLDEVKTAGGRLILPLNFPKAPDVSADEVELRDLKHWDIAPENPARCAAEGLAFALSSVRLGNGDDFLANLRTAVKRGLTQETALEALTTVPAEMIGMSDRIGTVEEGRLANLFLTSGCIFDAETKVIETWVGGERNVIVPLPVSDIRGSWSLSVDALPGFGDAELEIIGNPVLPKAALKKGEMKADVLKPVLDAGRFMFAFPGDSLGAKGIIRMQALVVGGHMSGGGIMPDGREFHWEADRTKLPGAPNDKAATENKATDVSEKDKEPLAASFTVVCPEGAYGREALPEQPETVLVTNATIWTSGPKGVLENADLLVKNGKVEKVAVGIEPPKNAVVIDAGGKHVTAGLIDAHSHLAVWGGVNEYTHSITSETRVEDVIDCDSINIYRQMAGGLTSSCILHGSANSIGGQNTVIKLRWGSMPEDMIVAEAVPTLKMALGENPKLANVFDTKIDRYPRSRLGVEQFIRDSFAAAKDYERSWQEYEDAGRKKKKLIPPRRDLRMEALVEVLHDERWIHCHSYRQDEIEALIAIAEDMGFRIRVFIHNLEGYKVADIMREHGSMPTVFSDWWAYKAEVYDSIPYNGAILHSRGLLTSFNSDDKELARRMNLEAAKAVKYGGVDPMEALKLVTINPAVQLGIDKMTGSLEKGKDADFVIWSGSPLSSMSICEQTWIDGRRYFDRDESRQFEERTARERSALIQKVLQSKNGK